MRSRTIFVLPLAVLAGPAFGQATPAAQSGRTTCVDVRIGNEQYYNCLNRELAASVPRNRLSAADSPNNASMPGTAAGLSDRSATREQLGTNFGISAKPQRPPEPNYPAPLHTH